MRSCVSGGSAVARAFGRGDGAAEATDTNEANEDRMANRAIWSMRLRHEWLKTPLKKQRLKKSQRIRVGLEAAMQRKAGPGSRAESESGKS